MFFHGLLRPCLSRSLDGSHGRLLNPQLGLDALHFAVLHNCARCPIMSPCLCHHYVITTLSICCRYVAISSLYHLSISAGNETSYNFIKYTKSAKTELMLHYVPTYFNTFQCVRPIANASWRHQYYNDMHMYAYCTEIRYHIITHRRRVLPGH